MSVRFFSLCLCVLVCAACTLGDAGTPVTETRRPNTDTPDQGESGIVTRVIDGDTIEVEIDDIIYDVRYIGINTPERSDPCFDEATNANAEFVQGRVVRLERDTSDTDRFGRLLRYVYVDDTFVNEELVQMGVAEVVLYQPDDREFENFRNIEQAAARNGIGCHGRVGEDIFDDGTYTR
jgi:endonuclease YncB( thermonuclease family)